MITSHLSGFAAHLALHCQFAEETIKNRISSIRSFESYLKKENLDFGESSFKEFLVYKKLQDYSATSITDSIASMRHFLDYLIKIGKWQDKNFAKEIPYPKRQNKKLPQTLSNEEIETIINYNRPEKVKGTTKKWRLLFHFLAKTGCRSSEVCKLNVEDVDFAQGLFTLKNTKTRVDRIVPIPPDMHKILEHWVVKERNAKPTDSLFPSAYGKARLTHTNIWAELRERVKQLGLRKNITTHHFRHSFVTELLRQDVSVAKVAQIVGHLHLTTTQMYTHLVIDDLKDAMSRHPLIKKHRDPREILIDLKEKIKGFKLADDPRFDYKISETSTSVSINIRLRKYPSENQSRNR